MKKYKGAITAILLTFCLAICCICNINFNINKTYAAVTEISNDTSLFITANKTTIKTNTAANTEVQFNINVTNQGTDLYGVDVDLNFDKDLFSFERFIKSSDIARSSTTMYHKPAEGTISIAGDNNDNAIAGNFSIGSFVLKVKAGVTVTANQTSTLVLNRRNIVTFGVPKYVKPDVVDISTITFEAPASDVTVSSLSYSGITLTHTGDSWSGTVPYTTSKINRSGIVTNKPASASITFNGLAAGAAGDNGINLTENAETIITIVVTAEDNTTTATYYLKLFREAGNTNVSIDNLNVLINSASLPLTIKNDTYTVTQKVSYADRNNVKVVITKPADSKATLKIANSSATWGAEKQLTLTANKDNNIIVTVTSETGIVKNYTLVINVLAGESNANLSAINLTYVGGEPITISPAITNGVYTYSAQVVKGTTQVVVAATTAGSKAIITSTLGTKTVPGSITINVKAEDGTTATYTIVVSEIVEASTDNTIYGISVEGFTIDFDENITVYRLEVPHRIDTINVIINADASAVVTGQGSKPIAVGLNTIKIYATSEAGTKGKEYTLIITRLDNIVRLSNLSITNFDMEETFSPDLFTYHIKVPGNVNSINIQATLPANMAGYFISGAQTYMLTNVGENNHNYISISIHDSSYPEIKLAEYTIIVTRASTKTEVVNGPLLYVFIAISGVFIIVSTVFIILFVVQKKKVKTKEKQ